MRGDLVFEKLGEIDPALLTEALGGPKAEAIPLVSVDSLFAVPQKDKKTKLRKAFVICACLLLGGALLIVGGVALSRSHPFATFFPATETSGETEDPHNPYEGIVTVTFAEGGETVVLEGNAFLEGIGDEMRNLLNQITLEPGTPDPDPLERYEYRLDVGGTEIWLNPQDGLFIKDRKAELSWNLDSETAWAFHTLFRRLREGETEPLPEDADPICEFIYEKGIRHPGDAFEVELRMNDSGDYKGSFELDRIYLYYEGEKQFFSIREYDVSIMCGFVFTVPDDAPRKDYRVCAEFHSDDYGDVTVRSDETVMTVEDNTKAPAYTFPYDPNQMSAHTLVTGDTLSLYAALFNQGDDIYRFGLNTVLHPKAELRTLHDGKTVSFRMDDGWITEDGEQVRFLRSGKAGEKTRFTLEITEDMPRGLYDLVLSFESHEQVFPGVIAIVDPNANHSFEVGYSFFPWDGNGDEPINTVTHNGKGYLSLSITHAGDTLYRYGYHYILRPDSVKLYRQEEGSEGESAILYYEIATEMTETLWAWENGITKTFLYEWDWKKAPIEPGTYALQVIYRDQNGNILLDLILEDVIDVVSP